MFGRLRPWPKRISFSSLYAYALQAVAKQLTKSLPGEVQILLNKVSGFN
jgi:hypothetical protein